MGTRVLLVEDEPEMQVLLRDNLEYEGWEVVSADTGEEGLRLAGQQHMDLILLDVMLPGISGYEVCRRVRQNGLSVPIIMLTARNTELDRVAGLELGADDYVGKPFSFRELIARVRAHLRRTKAGSWHDGCFAFGDITVDFARQRAFRGSSPLELSTREYELLRYLIGRQGEVVTREQLLADVWSYPVLPMTRTVDNFVARLRKKIEPDLQVPRFITTVHGAGYRFVA